MLGGHLSDLDSGFDVPRRRLLVYELVKAALSGKAMNRLTSQPLRATMRSIQLQTIEAVADELLVISAHRGGRSKIRPTRRGTLLQVPVLVSRAVVANVCGEASIGRGGRRRVVSNVGMALCTAELSI